MPTAIHRMLESAKKGDNKHVIGRMESGWVVIGETQIVPGYCLLLPDPVVPHLNALQGKQRLRFLNDMCLIGDAVLNVTKALRIKYEMLGNLEPALHAHIFPRFADEDVLLKYKPIWFYDWDKAHKFNLAEHGDIFLKIKNELKLENTNATFY